MSSNTTIQPSFSISPNITRTALSLTINSTAASIFPSSSVDTVDKDKPTSSSSGNIENLFSWVFIACVGLALLLIISIFMVIVCWNVKRRKRSATVTDVRKGANKERKRGRTNLRESLKRVFVPDGALYAVSNLNVSHYTGITEKQRIQNSDSSRSSAEIIISLPNLADNPTNISKDNQNVIYQRYLTPIEGVPTNPIPPRSVSPVRDNPEDETYLRPIDELRASKRFLQVSKEEPEDTYLEPLHGIPVPDDVQQKTSTPKPKPIPSPKPNVKPKPTR